MTILHKINVVHTKDRKNHNKVNYNFFTTIQFNFPKANISLNIQLYIFPEKHWSTNYLKWKVGDFFCGHYSVSRAPVDVVPGLSHVLSEVRILVIKSLDFFLSCFCSYALLTYFLGSACWLLEYA